MEQKTKVLESILELTEVVKSQKSVNESYVVYLREFNDDLNVVVEVARENPSDPEAVEKLISKLSEIQEALIASIKKHSDITSSLIQVAEKMADIFQDEEVIKQLH